MTNSAIAAVQQQMQLLASQIKPSMPISENQFDQPINFAETLEHSINRVDRLRQNAEAQAQAYERGDEGFSLNEVMLNLQKGSLALNMTIQTRNKLVNAYREIMSMQV